MTSVMNFVWGGGGGAMHETDHAYLPGDHIDYLMMQHSELVFMSSNIPSAPAN